MNDVMLLIGGPHDGGEIDADLFGLDRPLPAGLVISSGPSRFANYDLADDPDRPAFEPPRYRFAGWSVTASRPSRVDA